MLMTETRSAWSGEEDSDAGRMQLAAPRKFCALSQDAAHREGERENSESRQGFGKESRCENEVDSCSKADGVSGTGLDAGRGGVGAVERCHGGVRRRLGGVRGLLVASPLLLCTLLSLWWPCADAVTAVYIVPVYEWVLVFKEWRNPSYKFGSIWRPKMIEDYMDGVKNPEFPGAKNRELDGYDLRTYLSANIDVVHLGDVFVAGHEPPNFVGSVLIVDKAGSVCPVGVPCFTRDESTALFVSLLVVTPDPNLFEPIWASHVRQCVVQSPEGLPLLCAGTNKANGVCQEETGFAFGQTPITIFRPTCPNDYYVMGHVGLKADNGTEPSIKEQPPGSYKCIHESILRRVEFQPEPLFRGRGPVKTVWNPTLVPVEYDQPVSLWSAKCDIVEGFPVDQGCANPPYCQDAGITQGLFYASKSEDIPNRQISGSEASAPRTGPRCLAAYRDCTKQNEDGSVATNPTGSVPTGEILISGCDAELGTKEVSGNLQRRIGLTTVTPTGLPTMSATPLALKLDAAVAVCRWINQNPSATSPVPKGNVFINGFLVDWVSMTLTATTCSILVRVRLTGILKPGPATINIQAQGSNKVIKDVQFPIGKSLGRLYFYKSPDLDALVLMQTVINHPECTLNIVIRFPYYTQTLLYGKYYCEWQDTGETMWRIADQPALVDKPNLGYRGVQCSIPQRTGPSVKLRVTVTNKLVWHDLAMQITRNGDPDSEISSDGALRVYGITPNAGPEAGGTKITVQGEYFSKYCNSSLGGSCNTIQCNFYFSYGGSPILRAVDAAYVSDKVLTCVTPPVLRGKSTKLAKVQISVDLNPACSTGADDITNEYNQLTFMYQTTGTDFAVPDAATPASADPTVVPHRLQGPWTVCNINQTDKTTGPCAGWPDMDVNVTALGYVSCLPGFNALPRSHADYPGDATSPTYPVFCIRALPLNALANYQFTITDPFMNTVIFLQRICPQDYPGYCHRAEHQRAWGRFNADLDYRLFDINDKTYFKGEPMPAPDKETQGRNLIDRIWSTTAAQEVFGYMREVLHQAGAEYGFLALGIAVNIEMDFTLATTFSPAMARRTTACAKPNPKAARYSGTLGDTGPSGTFVDWDANPWEPGKPSCPLDDRYDPSLCESKVLKSPNHEDDTGVMLTKPAKMELTQIVEDNAVGCGRIRISFNCSRFSFDSCVKDLVETDTPNAQFRNTGSRQGYESYTSFCNFMYPETAGPNNPGGWNAPTVVAGEEDWRYFYRTSPCVRCRQQEFICASLFKTDTIVDDVPTGPTRNKLGDVNAAIEVTLGCFGQGETAVEDECCEDVYDLEQAVPLPNNCIRTLERCVRAAVNHTCARDDEWDGECSDRATNQWPLCAPRGLT